MNFLDRIKEEILVADGAIGTMLYNKGVSLEANFEHLNLVRPELVLELHQEYIAAGALMIETNTFGANHARLKVAGLEQKVRDINRQGAALARRAAGKNVFVAGSVGPLPRVKGEESDFSAAEMLDIYREQTLALAEGGVDLFILETFSDISQIKEALTAAKETGLPVIASMAFLEKGRTSAGMEVERLAIELDAAGADVLGANCGSGTLDMMQNILRMASASDRPLAAFPNSGFPEYVNGRYIYRTTPEYFTDMALEICRAGANVIGGCCGTTPEHIRLLSARIRGLRPALRIRVVKPAVMPEIREAGAEQAGFLKGWGEKKIVTVELDPPKGLDCGKVLAGCRVLKEAGADAINLAENPLARVRLGNIALANLIQHEIGIEVIVHVTCRDRNLIGMQSELMGASLLGIRSILAVTGDPASIGELSGATSVFDLNSFSLIKLLQDLNSGVNGLGNSIDRGAGFTIGAAFNPNSERMETQVARLERKIANGARFVQTQPIYDMDILDEMLERTRHLDIPFLPGILPLVSERNTEFLHNEVPGIVIPERIRARMRGKDGEAGTGEGLAIASEFIASVKDRVGGFYIIPPFGKYLVAAELVRFIRE
ncbi:MAG: homocysteine methyltransferase [Geobacteraceae bacterium]|nr:homocysteine methyltransferase [Geobacteraceae bacterium]